MEGFILFYGIMTLVFFMGMINWTQSGCEESHLKDRHLFFFCAVWPITLISIILGQGVVSKTAKKDYREYKEKAEADGVIFIDSVEEYSKAIHNPESFKRRKQEQQLSKIAEREFLGRDSKEE